MYQLLDLLQTIVDLDPNLTNLLRGKTLRRNVFGYDSPKFVEAVIRLARGDIAHLAASPIVRVDEDVELNAESLSLLLVKHLECSEKGPFYFFSGRYGGDDDDPINDYAVRVHWFAPIGHKKGDRLSDDIREKIQHFLSDLTELGATQHDIKKRPEPASAMNSIIDRRGTQAPHRQHMQVISGAGLIMSTRAVNFLPPFMNISQVPIWIDDAIKRRLHEALLDLSPNDLESASAVLLHQDRHRDVGVQAGDMDFAEDVYFDRLLFGCLMFRIISEIDGTPTEYSRAAENIVRMRAPHRSQLGRDKRKILTESCQKLAVEHYREVIHAWQSPEYEDTLSHKWAAKKAKDKAHENEVCSSIAKSAVDYLDLLYKWPVFVRAIQRLALQTNMWLYYPA